ncbi:YicC family protein [Bacillus timonensis]|nr:YicC family protein [Bacillus timonensis]
MIESMTGFGRGIYQTNTCKVTVEIKSVNHRFCEINIRMPRQLLVLEDKMKKAINNVIKRGRVEVFLTIEGEGFIKKSIRVDWKLVDDYYEIFSEAKKRLSLDSHLLVDTILQQENVISVNEEETDIGELEENIFEALQAALTELSEMRVREGTQLIQDIITYISQIVVHIEGISKRSPIVVKQYRERLMKKVSEFVESSVEEDRILAEVAIFSEKADISEEITRMNSHINQFNDTLSSNEQTVGRKLDFIVQELNREINTIGSKANDSSIAGHVVEVKSLLEKIKEQVQNIQ